MFVLKDGRDQGKERPAEFTDSEAFFAKGSGGENAAAACSAQGTHCQHCRFMKGLARKSIKRWSWLENAHTDKDTPEDFIFFLLPSDNGKQDFFWSLFQQGSSSLTTQGASESTDFR